MRDSLYIGTALVAVLFLPPSAWAHSPEAGIRACAAISDNGARLQCFDALAAETTHVAAPSASPDPVAPEPAAPASSEPAPGPAPEPTPATEPAVAAAPAAAATELEPISDDFGAERISEERERQEPEKYAARVTRCQENKQSGQYYFFFENGQVWKQANYQRLYWRDCEFDVSISKGKLGYDMYVPEKDRRVRVARIR